MKQVQPPKIVKKKLFSPIWLLPLVALALATWLGVQSIRQSGIEIQVHFPNATGIDVGKTLVRYEGLTVGKVTDIAIDKNLQGVEVKILMDSRSEAILTEHTDFWLVTPKASITGIEGLDTLFSGNYIAIFPGKGKASTEFTAVAEAPPILPGKEGKIIHLVADKLGSLDVGSSVFYRQIPVGSVVNYRLVDAEKIAFTIFVKEKYADLVRTDSRFWNVSGISVDASLTGLKVQSESIAAILAGGISFSTGELDKVSDKQTFTLYPTEDKARGGQEFTLDIAQADQVHNGTIIQYLGLAVGDITGRELVKDGIKLHARIFTDYQHLLGPDSQFYLAGAEVSLSGIKHASRLLTGDNIILIPSSGSVAQSEHQKNPAKHNTQLHFPLLANAPELAQDKQFELAATSPSNLDINIGAPLQYKNFTIGAVTGVELSRDFSQVNYRVQVQAQYQALFTQASYLVPRPLVAVTASLSGIQVDTGDISNALTGALELVSVKAKPLASGAHIKLYPSVAAAEKAKLSAQQTSVKLIATNAAGLSTGSKVFYKKMTIGEVTAVTWQADDSFTINLGIDKQFSDLIDERSVFWQNSAIAVAANLQGINVDVAPLGGLGEGSLSLGRLKHPRLNKALTLYQNQDLALAQAELIAITFPADGRLKAGAEVRYQGYRIGAVEQVNLSQDLQTIEASVYLDGKYAKQFKSHNSQYVIVDAQISLRGIKAPETLITGAYISVTPGNDAKLSQHFKGEIQGQIYANTPEDSLRLTLVRNHLGSINQGTGIFYRGVAVGKVAGFELANNGQSVNIFIEINEAYRSMVNRSSRFYDISGFNMDVGLFSGAQIATSSLESLIAGGIALATEQSTQSQNQLQSGDSLPLYDKAEPQWSSWQPSQH